jgi:hypothetical protein
VFPLAASPPSTPTEKPSYSVREAIDQAAGTERAQRLALLLNTLFATLEVNPYRLAEKSGVNPSTIGRWLKR